MRKFLPHLLLFIAPFTLRAQIGGSPSAGTCANAVTIAALPYNSPIIGKYTTCGDGNTYTSAHACANTFANGEDFLFKFTPTAANNCVTISSSAYQNNFSSIFVFDGCPNVATTNCVAQVINLDVSNVPLKTITISNLQLTAGTTYYIMLSSSSGCYQFDFSISAGTCSGPPPGNSCANPIVIPNLPYADNGSTTCNNKPFYNQGNTKCYGYGFLNGNSKTYSITPTEDQCARITLKTDSIYSGLFLYEGCPTNPSSKCVAYRTYIYGSAVINTVLKAGVTYYIVVNSYSAYTTCTNYDLSVVNLDKTGSVCSNAYEFPTNSYTFYDHTNQCKGNDYNKHTGCNSTGTNYMNGEETVYKFQGVKGECIGITLRVLDDYKNAGLYLLTGCPSDLTTKCLNFGSKYVYGNNDIISFEYTIDSSQTYYIVVSTPYQGDYYNYNYNLSISSSLTDSVGVRCGTAEVISAPIQKKHVEVSCKGNEYNNSHACRSNYMAGNDYVLKFTAKKKECLKFTATQPSGKGGIFLLDECPDKPAASCLASAVIDFLPSDSLIFIYTVDSGQTYYIVVAAYSGGTSFGCDLTIDEIPNQDACTYCNTNICIACKNVGFERMDFTGWQGFTGSVAAPDASAGLSSGPVNNGDSRHTIMSQGSYDPMAGPDLKVVSPAGGNYAVRLGNRLTGAQGEVLSYSFTVDSNTLNFFYYYAVVFQDPGSSHTDAEKPYFRVRMFDQVGTEIQCAHYEVRAGPSIPGFKDCENDTEGIWKDWTLVAVPLNNYFGQTVKIEFTTLDCTQSGHYGYAYIDAFCGDINITSNKPGICRGEQVTLTAPDGFASYLWSNGANTQSITVAAAGVYSVQVTPFGNSAPLNPCVVTLQYEVKVYEFPSGTINFNLGCPDSLVDVSVNPVATTENPITKYSWDFGDGTTGTATPVTHGFPGPGTYTVSLTIETAKECNKTIKRDVIIDPYPIFPDLQMLDTIKVCEKQEVNFTSLGDPDITYSWTGPNGFSSNIRNPKLNSATVADSGMFYLNAQSKKDPCLTKKDSTYLFVKKFPVFAIKKDTTICFNDTTLIVWATGGEGYTWTPANLLESDNEDSVKATVTSDATLTVVAKNNLCPDSTMNLKITINKPSEDLVVSGDVKVCVGDSFQIGASAKPNNFILWSGPGGYSYTGTQFSRFPATPPMKGYYYATSYLGTNKYCPFGFDSVYADVLLLPILNVTPGNAQLCPGDSVILTVNGANIYNWTYTNYQQFATGNQVKVGPTGTTQYLSNGTDNNGCEADTNVTVQVKPLFSPDLGPDKTLCLGQTHTINLNTSSFHKTPTLVKWNTGATGNSITVSSTGKYWAEVNIDNCLKTDTILVTFINPASFDLGPDVLICQGQDHVLDVSSYGNNVIWSDGSTDLVRTISYPGGKYKATIKNGVCTLVDSININFQNKHTVNLGVDQQVCLGGSVTLSSPYPQNTNLWKDGTIQSTGSTYAVSSVGLHQVFLDVTIGVCTSSDTVNVDVQTPPVPQLGPNDTVCENQSVLLDPGIPNADSYLWNTGTTGATFTATAPGFYKVTITKGACVVADWLTIFHDLIPTVNIGPDQTICEDKTALFDASASIGTVFNWNTGESTPSITKNAPGQYIVTILNGKCTFQDTANLLVDQIPTFDLGPDRYFCDYDSALLSCAVPAVSYLWSSGQTSQNIYVHKPGKVYLTTTRGMCNFTDSLIVQVKTAPVLNIGLNDTICQGDSVVFQSNVPADTYLWNDGTSKPNRVGKTPGYYVLQIVDGPCVVKDSAFLQIDIPPIVDLGSDIKVCQVADTLIGKNIPGCTYVWNTGETSPTIRAQSAGKYWVDITKGACTVKDSLLVTVQPMHMVSLPKDSVLCVGQLLTLKGVTNALNPVFSWNTGGYSDQIYVTASGSYILSVTTGVCTNSDTINATFLNPPFVSFGNDLVKCLGEVVTLDAKNPGYNYTWSTGETTQTILVTQNGNYSVTAYVGPCSSTDNIDVTFKIPPVVDLGNNQEWCAGTMVLLDAMVPQVEYYQWNTTATTRTIKPTKSGWYKVAVKQGPCIVTDSVFVKFHALPLNRLEDTQACPNDSAFITTYCDSCSYLWNDGFTGSAKWITPPDIAEVTVTSQFGCSVQKQATIRIDRDCPDNIYVPNSFTPNHDGVNDLFTVYTSNTTINSLQIYNRWGEKVFETTDALTGWNGTFRGEILKEDTYTWKVVYTDQYGMAKSMAGHVNLLK